MTETKEEEKELINNSEVEQKASEPLARTSSDDSSETKNKKVKFMLYVMVGIALGCILIWLIVGRIQSYITDSDNVELKDKVDKLKHDLNKEADKNKELISKLETMALELESVRNKNAYLHTELKTRQDVIDSLNGKIAAKDEKIIELTKTVNTLNNHVKELTRKLEAQDIVIADLKDDVSELYTDMRLIVSITNQELNRNQGLTKEIDYLEAKVTSQNHIIGNLTWEIHDVKEKLKDEKEANTLDWLKYNLLRRKCKQEVEIASVWKGSKSSCDSERFYNSNKYLKPNLFLATENRTGLVFGGYTTETWENTQEFKTDPEALTFSASNKAFCTLTKPEQAINTERTRFTKKLLLTFGGFDIAIADDCLKTSMHEININHSYQCPTSSSTPKNFYTEDANPVLSRFEFFTVKFNNL
jgi:hypothetical protein